MAQPVTVILGLGREVGDAVGLVGEAVGEVGDAVGLVGSVLHFVFARGARRGRILA